MLFQIPSTFNATQAMAFDGCFHDNEMELTPFPRMTPTLTSDPLATPSQVSDTRPIEGTRLRRQRSVRENVDLLVSNSYLIDSYSRLAFPLSYLLFNTIYWSLYSWGSEVTLTCVPSLGNQVGILFVREIRVKPGTSRDAVARLLRTLFPLLNDLFYVFMRWNTWVSVSCSDVLFHACGFLCKLLTQYLPLNLPCCL